MRSSLVIAVLAVAACSGSHHSNLSDGNSGGDGGGGGGDGGGGNDAGTISLATHSTQQLCKLLSSTNTETPTPNDVQHRANILGADLGIPLAFANQLFIFFGDTVGYMGIWGDESHPDAVGYGTDPASMLQAHPDLLCSDLRFLTIPANQSIGATISGAGIVTDFAGAAMGAPTGGMLSTYIHNPAGGGSTFFPYLPGDFEVPSGAFTYDSSIYVFYTTVDVPSTHVMKASYLAQWVAPTSTGTPGYQILYQVDEAFDANGPLHGHFINISAEVSGDYVYVYGTGTFRASPIYIARKRLDTLQTAGGWEELGTVTTVPGFGETSVHYFPEIQQWMILAEDSRPPINHIVAFVSASPEGPWTPSTTVLDMADPTFRSEYCCTTDDHCTDPQMFNCDMTGFYGAYMLPWVIQSSNTFTITYTLSSFSPYNVGLFQTTFTP